MQMALALAAAAGLGALHSLEPGHGKGVLTAYLISIHAKAKDAILLGIVSTLAHTLSIFILSLFAISTVQMLIPEHFVWEVELVSGVLIALIGTRMLYRQRHPRLVVVGKIGHAKHDDSCGHQHIHLTANHSDHAPASARRLLIIGLLAGIIPCPSALAVLLAAVGTDRLPSGIWLVAAFSLGGAISMCGIGLLAVNAGNRLRQLEKSRIVRSLASASSFLIVFLGGLIAIQSFVRLGW